MEKIPVTNDTDATIFVGGKMITAGETRHFYPSELPPEYQSTSVQEAEEEPPTDPLEELRGQSVKAITGLLPNLKIEELQALETLENAQENPRASLLAVISTELLRRAADKDKQDLLASLTELADDDLEKALIAEIEKGAKADNELVEAIDAEITKRLIANLSNFNDEQLAQIKADEDGSKHGREELIAAVTAEIEKRKG